MGIRAEVLKETIACIIVRFELGETRKFSMLAKQAGK